MRRGKGVAGKVLDHAFGFAFRGLVYAQIWEDPDIDIEALDIRPDSRVVAIASGGCNVLSYLVADPEAITALDLNTAHIALARLKLASVRHLPDYDHFRRFFAQADRPSNLAAYHAYVAPYLDDATRRYWEGRDITLRPRIGGFRKGIYKRGLLGGFIGVAHLLARLYRIDIKSILTAPTQAAQREVFEAQLAPLFDRKFVRWLAQQPAALFALGIPPAQFASLTAEQPMAQVLRRRLEKLACDFAVEDNYFAWLAFSRGYGRDADASLPPYLQRANWDTVRARVDRVSVRHADLTAWLESQADASLDRYVLLDAQDWMDDARIAALWVQITRTARAGARVLFRTAGEVSLLPGRIDPAVLARWHYHADASADYTRRDRSAIFGGVHLYSLDA